jgi:beta-glucanase (GH16 family)
MKKHAFLLFLVMLVYAASVKAAVPTGYGLLWSDEFNGTKIDTANWSFDTGVGNPPGWGNAEAEYYTNGTNFTVDSGYGILWAKKESIGGRSYSSCRMKTKGKKEFKYGYFEARIRTPHGNGLWPAFWTLGANIDTIAWPSCGEVELYEQRTGPQTYNLNNVGATPGDNCYVTTCHYSGTYGSFAPVYNTQQNNYTACLCNEFHTYSILWDSTSITYAFDGTQKWKFTNINLTNNIKSFHQRHFFIANIAVGGNYQGNNIDNSIFPQKMAIDYLRVYQKGVGTTVPGAAERQSVRPFTIVNPSKSQLKVFDLNGRIVADYTSRVRMLAAGDAATKALPSSLCSGAYIARFYDGAGTSTVQKLVTSR